MKNNEMRYATKGSLIINQNIMSFIEKIKQISSQQEEEQIFHILKNDLIKFWWFTKDEIIVTFITENLFAVWTHKNISFIVNKIEILL